MSGISNARDADIGAEYRQVDGQKMENEAGFGVYRGAIRASILRLSTRPASAIV
jgi:hypothetical protein